MAAFPLRIAVQMDDEVPSNAEARKHCDHGRFYLRDDDQIVILALDDLAKCIHQLQSAARAPIDGVIISICRSVLMGGRVKNVNLEIIGVFFGEFAANRIDYALDPGKGLSAGLEIENFSARGGRKGTLWPEPGGTQLHDKILFEPIGSYP